MGGHNEKEIMVTSLPYDGRSVRRFNNRTDGQLHLYL